jgi:hypothetical protein
MRSEMPPLRSYAAADLGHAALYALAAALSPTPAVGPRAVVLTFAAFLATTGVGLLLRARWGRLLGLATSVALLACAFMSISLLVASAAYLRGIFGGLGEGAALLCLVAAALVIEFMVLLPAFQVRFLLRDDVRRLFGQ